MAFIKRFEDIQGWQEARRLSQEIYSLSAVGAFAKDFELRNRIRAAAVSAMSNVAEGFDCDSKVEFARFLGFARRSAVEVQSILYVALDANYIDEATFKMHYAQADRTKGLIGALRTALLKSKP